MNFLLKNPTLALSLTLLGSMPVWAQPPLLNPTQQRPANNSWPNRPPARIYVMPFHLDPALAQKIDQANSTNNKGPARQFRDTRPRAADVVTGNDRSAPIGESIAKQVAKNLADAKVPAVFWNQPTPPPADGWKLTGQVVALDEGHKLAQNAIGFGAGNKKVAVDVAMADPNTGGGQPFFLLDTSDKGRHMPGTLPLAAIRGFNPITMGAKVVASESGVKDVSQQHKIASEISDEVIKGLKAHGQYHKR